MRTRASVHEIRTVAPVKRLACVLAIAFVACMAGCSSYSALPSGSEAPPIVASGWTNGEAPGNLDGKVVVLEVFATW